MSNKNQTLYMECSSGISGDMSVAALLDLGADREVLQEALKSLPLEGFETEISVVTKSAICACDFNVKLDEAHENHDHDMEYLHGEQYHEHEEHEGHHHGHGMHEHEEHEGHHHGHGMHEHEEHEGHHHGHGMHEHEEHEGHHHGHGMHEHEEHEGHHHDHDAHHHVHRGIREIREIIEAASITAGARDLALKIFEIIAEAESKAHGLPVEEVHFHEVGAVDSIVDVVAFAVCFDNLGIRDVVVSPLTEGMGTVRCQHGILPVPVPAVLNICSANALPLHISSVAGELVTPTGAAIAAAVRTADSLPDSFRVLKTGIGAGKRKYECPGFLRVMLIEKADQASQPEKKEEISSENKICKLETNIDDSTGEELGFVMSLLFEAGARDVFYQPVFMKKNRPGWLLSVICMEKDRGTLSDIIFRNTTTIGIRYADMDRMVLQRELKTIATPYGNADIKICCDADRTMIYPEYESVTALCRKSSLSYREAYQMILRFVSDEEIL